MQGARSHYDGRDRIRLDVFSQNLAIAPPHFDSALSLLTLVDRGPPLGVGCAIP